MGSDIQKCMFIIVLTTIGSERNTYIFTKVTDCSQIQIEDRDSCRLPFNNLG